MNHDPLSSVGELPEPSAPTSIERVVMARIARMADAPPRVQAVPDRKAQWLDVPAWAASVAGLAIFIGSWIAGHVESGLLVAVQVSPQTAAAALVHPPATLTAMLGITVGSILFVGGLFLPDPPSFPRPPASKNPAC
ncbi:MAG TPA: hypothetical protein VN700_00435 [Vicinamibacterales bacterium]|nr:hypothetical protein [Vicinamibacterales bacterium]